MDEEWIRRPVRREVAAKLWSDERALDDRRIQATRLGSCMQTVEAVGDLVPAELLIDQRLDEGTVNVVTSGVVGRPVGVEAAQYLIAIRSGPVFEPTLRQRITTGCKAVSDAVCHSFEQVSIPLQAGGKETRLIDQIDRLTGSHGPGCQTWAGVTTSSGHQRHHEQKAEKAVESSKTLHYSGQREERPEKAGRRLHPAMTGRRCLTR